MLTISYFKLITVSIDLHICTAIFLLKNLTFLQLNANKIIIDKNVSTWVYQSCKHASMRGCQARKYVSVWACPECEQINTRARTQFSRLGQWRTRDKIFCFHHIPRSYYIAMARNIWWQENQQTGTFEGEYSCSCQKAKVVQCDYITINFFHLFLFLSCMFFSSLFFYYSRVRNRRPLTRNQIYYLRIYTKTFLFQSPAY